MKVVQTDAGTSIKPDSGMLLTNGEIYFAVDTPISLSASFDVSHIYEIFPENIPSEDLEDGLNNEYWDSFYKDGRTDYSYGFVNNGISCIVPPKPIDANLISYIFMNCTNLKDASGIIINLSADKPKCVSICMGCALMKKPPKINFTGKNAHVCRSYVSAFANCRHLQECAIWFGDGTQSASGERTDMANTFLNCEALTHIAFTGKGSPKSLDLSSCKKVTAQSIQGLLNALMDVSKETSGTYEITIGAETDELLSDEIKIAFADKGWMINVKEDAE